MCHSIIVVGLSSRQDGSQGHYCRRLCECRPILDLQSRPHTLHQNSSVVAVVPSFLRLRFSCRLRTLLALSFGLLSCTLIVMKFSVLHATQILWEWCFKPSVWSSRRPCSACIVHLMIEYLAWAVHRRRMSPIRKTCPDHLSCAVSRKASMPDILHMSTQELQCLGSDLATWWAIRRKHLMFLYMFRSGFSVHRPAPVWNQN